MHGNFFSFLFVVVVVDKLREGGRGGRETWVRRGRGWGCGEEFTGRCSRFYMYKQNKHNKRKHNAAALCTIKQHPYPFQPPPLPAS